MISLSVSHARHDLPVVVSACPVRQTLRRGKVVRAKPDLSSRISLFLPVQSHSRKYFRFRLTQISSVMPPSRPTKGAYRDRHGRGAGCDGRRQHR
jgi:hypothetical protein